MPVSQIDPSSDASQRHAPANKAGQTAPSFSPLYQQIKSLLLQSLQRAEWRPGELIPSELELCARYGVSQGTVRKAIDELAAENLLVRRQGKGTYVATHAETQVQYRFLQLVPDVGDRNQEGPADRMVVDCRKIRATAEIAKLLGLTGSEPVLMARRVLSFSKVPTVLEDIWLPGGPFKGLTAERLSNHQGPMYALFEAEFGVRMVRASEKIKAVVATAAQAALLQIAPGTPLLSVERVAYTYRDLPMELRRALYRTDTHHYRNELG
jgi:GntR family transcriptional regulator